MCGSKLERRKDSKERGGVVFKVKILGSVKDDVFHTNEETRQQFIELEVEVGPRDGV